MFVVTNRKRKLTTDMKNAITAKYLLPKLNQISN